MLTRKALNTTTVEFANTVDLDEKAHNHNEPSQRDSILRHFENSLSLVGKPFCSKPWDYHVTRYYHVTRNYHVTSVLLTTSRK